MLTVAGTLNLYNFAFAVQEDDLATLSLALLLEVEILAGLWLLCGIHPEETRPWVVAAFTGLGVSSFYHGLTGRCHCGCFGTMVVNPWYVLVFDAIAVATLLKWQSPRGRDAIYLAPLTLVGLTLTGLLVGIAGIGRQSLVSVAGSANRNGRPLVDTLLVIRGKSVEFPTRTDHAGFFRLPPVRPGQYSVSVTKGESPSPPLPDPSDGQGLASKKDFRKSQRPPRGRLAKEKGPVESRGPTSDLARQYADRDIVPLALDECSATDVIIEFR